jgi:hypothetical protein
LWNTHANKQLRESKFFTKEADLLKNNLKIKKFIATTLGVALFAAAPATVMANSITQVDNTIVIEVSISSIAQVIQSPVVPAQDGSVPLRQLAQNLGADAVDWDGFDRSIDVTISGGQVISFVNRHLGIDVTGLVHEGTLVLPLTFTGNAITVARGHAAGQNFPATLVNDRVMLLPPGMPALTPDNAAFVLAQPIFADALRSAIIGLTGASSVSVVPSGDVIVITIVD